MTRNLYNQSDVLIAAEWNPGQGANDILRGVQLADALSHLNRSVCVLSNSIPSRLVRRFRDSFDVIETGSNFRNCRNSVASIVHRIQPRQIITIDSRDADHFDWQFPDSSAELYRLPCIELDSHSWELEFGLIDRPKPGVSTTRQRSRTRIKRILLVSRDDDRARQFIDNIDGLGKQKISVDVLSAGCSNDDLLDVDRSESISIRFHRNWDRLPALLEQVELAIVDSMDSCFSANLFNVPVIYSGPESAIALELASAGAIAVHSDSKPQSNLSSLIKCLGRDTTRRMQMTETAAAYVDGKGVERLARQFVGQAYDFRPLENSDLIDLRNWWSDPEFRSLNCISRHGDLAEIVQKNRKINDSGMQVWRVENEIGEACGVIGLKRSPHQQSVELSFNLVPEVIRTGHRLALIEKLCRFVKRQKFAESIFCAVNAKNIESQKDFYYANFRASEPLFARDGRRLKFEYAIGGNNFASVPFRKAS